jgi:integrase
MLIGVGVNVKSVSERLSHATVGITEDLYAHVLPHMQDECVRVIDEKITPHLKNR